MRRLGTPPTPTEDVEAILERYSEAVNLYSKRTMSHETDALKAFAAVLNLFHSGFKGGYLARLPMVHLERVLLWLPNATMTRRTDQTGNVLFPNWSWAGWSGKINMPDSSPRFPRFKWLYPDLDVPASETRFKGESESADDQLNNAKRLEFEALAAKLPLRPGRGAIWRMKAGSNRHLDPEICSYYVGDITQRRDMAGVVYIHAEGLKPWDDITFDYEMIVMSRSTHLRLPNKGSPRPLDDEADLVEWTQSFSPDDWKAAEEIKKTFRASYNVDLDRGMYDVLVITCEGGIAPSGWGRTCFCRSFSFRESSP